MKRVAFPDTPTALGGSVFRAIILAALLIAAYTSVYAQTGRVCIYSDAGGSECLFTDSVGPQVFHVFLIEAPGASAVGFSAPVSPCMAGMSWLSDTAVWPVTLGDSQDGVSIGFGRCDPGPVHVLTINYFSNGIVQSDCAYPVLADPLSGASAPQWVDCLQGLHEATAGTAYINSALGCDCPLQEPPPGLEVTPSELVFEEGESVHVLSIRNAGSGVLGWALDENVGWLSLSQTQGVNDADVNVIVQRNSLAVGVHQTNIEVSSTGGDATVPVTVIQPATGGPRLNVDRNSLIFYAADSQKSFEVRNIGTGVLDFTITSTASWLTTTPTAGAVASLDTSLIQVDVDRDGLSAGNHHGQIHIASNGGSEVIAVTATVVTGPVLDVTPSALFLQSQDADASLSVVNAGVDVLTWSIAPDVPWLDVTPASGVTATTDLTTITPDRSGLSNGQHYANLQVTSDGGDALVPVTVWVFEHPELDIVPTTLEFAYDVSQLELTVRNVGANILDWTAAPDVSWMSVTPDAGTIDGPAAVVQIDIDRTNLQHGTYNASIAFNSNGGNVTIPVAVEVLTGPEINIIPSAITFTTSQNVKAFRIENVGIGELAWSIVEDIDWLSFDLTSGNRDTNITGEVDVATAPPSGVDETVQVNSNGGEVTLNVLWRPTVSNMAGTIGIFMDVVGANACLEEPAGSGLFTVHVVHTNTIGATASQFSAPLPMCWTGVSWISDTPVYGVTLGNSQTGVAVGYGQCVPAPNHILSINVFAQGLLDVGCCAWSVVADPNVSSGKVEVVNCVSQLLPGNGMTSFVSATPCNCGIGVRTEHSTWGAIKALYLDDAQMQRLRGEQRRP